MPDLGKGNIRISIHALLAESDSVLLFSQVPVPDFYPRSPCGERLLILPSKFTAWAFLSTLSLRRATQQKCRDGKPNVHFYPRSPCGERRYVVGDGGFHKIFLSTLSLRRATLRACRVWSRRPYFYPRSPCGERPTAPIPAPIAAYFYPRSPCGERQPVTRRVQNLLNFYPRSPCGERHLRSCMPTGPRYFYPRSPCGERPIPYIASVSNVDISIHALLAESDPLFPAGEYGTIFLSTLSLRRATVKGICFNAQIPISIHALLAESDPSEYVRSSP